jgi:hypothetical protein
MIQFTDNVQCLLSDSIVSNSTETSIVRHFTNSVASITGAFDGGRGNVRSKFIHQRPYALFVNPPIIEGKRRDQIRRPRRVQQQGTRSLTGNSVN